jgi:hypothetical protein
VLAAALPRSRLTTGVADLKPLSHTPAGPPAGVEVVAGLGIAITFAPSVGGLARRLRAWWIL